MPRFAFQHRVDIAAPSDLVWQVLTDFPSYRDWNPFCIECACDLRPGGAIRMTVALTGKPQKVEEWVHQVQPGQGFSYAMKPAPLGLLRSRRSHQITALPNGSCRYVSDFELTGPMAPVLKLLLGKRLHAGFAAMTHAVQRRAESLQRSV